MFELRIIAIVAALWGWLLQRIAEHRGGAPSTAANPALTQIPHLLLWVVGSVLATLITWRTG